MRKKIIFLSLFLSLSFIFSVSMVFAQGSDDKNTAGKSELTQDKGSEQEPQQGSTVQKNQPEDSRENGANIVQEQNQERERASQEAEGSGGNAAGEQVRQQVRAKNTEELKTMIKEKKQAMSQQAESIKDKKQQKVYQNQNKVREAVHALLAAEDLLGAEGAAEGKGIGREVSEIAKGFDNSVNKTIQAEEKIQKRNGVVKFFFGGDKDAAENILRETNQNKEKIQQLKKLQQDCECGTEVKNIIQEQIQNIEQEQNRLGQLAQEEKSKKGLFGWLFGWMQK